MISFYTYLEIYLDDLNKQVSLSEFEIYFRKPHQTIKLHLEELVKNKILLFTKKARFSFYNLNIKNPLLKDYLSICEKERLFKFIEKNTLFRRLHYATSGQIDKILVFGSSAKGEDFSDIDLLIISENREIRKIIDEFMNTYTIKIHIVQTDENHLTASFITEIKKKHIIFSGHDYFIRRLYKHELGMV